MEINNRSVLNGIYVNKLAWKRALTYHALPKWSRTQKNRGKILSIYIKAQNLNINTGKKYEVDHIIPLYSNLVCGLHVHENLQILSHARNKVKSNTFIPYREFRGRKYYYNSSTLSVKQIKLPKRYNPTKKNPVKLIKRRLKTASRRVVSTVKKRG